MLVNCRECGAELRLNPKLAGTSVSCPACGERVTVPKEPAKSAAPKKKLQLEPEPPPPPPAPAPAKRPEPASFYLRAAQGTLMLLALLSFVSAFRPGDWEPPSWSWFAEHQLILIGVGVAFAFCAFMARYSPRVMTLLALLLVCGGIYASVELRPADAHVDASRTLALSATLLACWFAMEHRRFVRD